MLRRLVYICAALGCGFEVYAGVSGSVNIPALVAGSLFGLMGFLTYLESRKGGDK